MNKGVSHMIATVNKNDLIVSSVSLWGTSKSNIRQGKELLIPEVFTVYQNAELCIVPATIATELLCFDVQNSTFMGVKIW